MRAGSPFTGLFYRTPAACRLAPKARPQIGALRLACRTALARRSVWPHILLPMEGSDMLGSPDPVRARGVRFHTRSRRSEAQLRQEGSMQAMRVMLMIKGDPEPGAAPSEELLAAMGRYNDELKKAGVVLDLAGLYPS